MESAKSVSKRNSSQNKITSDQKSLSDRKKQEVVGDKKSQTSKRSTAGSSRKKSKRSFFEDDDYIATDKTVVIKSRKPYKFNQSYDNIISNKNMICLIANSQIDSFDQFKELFLLNPQYVLSLQIIIENKDEIDFGQKLSHKLQKSYYVDNQIQTKAYDQMIIKQEEREFIQSLSYLKSAEGVTFFQLQTIHTTKEQYRNTFVDFFGIQPKTKKVDNTIMVQIELNVPTLSGELARAEIKLIQSLYSIQNMSNQYEVDKFKKQVLDKKQELLGLIQSGDWEQIYKLSYNRIFRCYLDDIQIKDRFQEKKQVINQKQFINGLVVCKYRDVEYVQIMSYLQTVMNQKTIIMDIKRLLNNPINIQKKDILDNYPWINFIFSPKADGIRCLLIMQGTRRFLLMERQLKRLPDSPISQNFIIEAEQIGNDLLCYDILLYDGVPVVDRIFSKRIDLLQQFVLTENSKKGELFGNQYSVKIKQYEIIREEMGKKQLKTLLEKLLEQSYKTDGLIINSNESYAKQQIFKWKPRELLSIDLYVRAISRTKLPGGFNPDKLGQTPMVLFTNISSADFKLQSFETLIKIPNPSQESGLILVPFQPALCPKCFIYWRDLQDEQQESIDGKVCEFAYDVDKKEWCFLRIRKDKNPEKGQFGNYFTVAENTFFDIVNYLGLECIYDISFKNNMYFQTPTQIQYKQMTKYMNFIKRIVVNLVCNPSIYKETTIIDIGIGRGQDINKYANNTVKKVIGVEIDLDAIQELISRKNQTKQIKFPIIETLIYDFKNIDHINDFVRLQNKQNIHAIFMMFSLHYLLSNFENLVSVLNLVKSGGYIVISCMDGKQVFDMLANKQQVQVVDNGETKYQYVRQYSENVLLERGQFISLKLPFSSQLMKEQLVNTKYIIKRLNSWGFQTVQNFSFDLQGNYNLLKKDDVAEAFSLKNQLSDVDISHISLYSCLIFKKK